MILFLIINSGGDSPLFIITVAILMTALGIFGQAWTEHAPNNTAAPQPAQADRKTWLYARYEKEYLPDWSLSQRLLFAEVQYSLENGDFPFELMKQLKALSNEKKDETPPLPLEKKTKQVPPGTTQPWDIVKKRNRNAQQFSS